jgi:hypothetical protein
MKALPRLALALRLTGKFEAKTDPALVRELGEILSAIRAGQPAGKVFRQNEGAKPKRTNTYDLAVLYYYTLACSKDPANYKEAIAAVKAATDLQPPRSGETIRKYAQRHRIKVLQYLTASAEEPQAAGCVRLWIYGILHPEGIDEAYSGDPEHDADFDAGTEAALRELVNKAVKPLRPAGVKKLREYLDMKSRKPKPFDFRRALDK